MTHPQGVAPPYSRALTRAYSGYRVRCSRPVACVPRERRWASGYTVGNFRLASRLCHVDLAEAAPRRRLRSARGREVPDRGNAGAVLGGSGGPRRTSTLYWPLSGTERCSIVDGGRLGDCEGQQRCGPQLRGAIRGRCLHRRVRGGGRSRPCHGRQVKPVSSDGARAFVLPSRRGPPALRRPGAGRPRVHDRLAASTAAPCTTSSKAAGCGSSRSTVSAAPPPTSRA